MESLIGTEDPLTVVRCFLSGLLDSEHNIMLLVVQYLVYIDVESAMTSLMFFSLVRLTKDGVDRKYACLTNQHDETMCSDSWISAHLLEKHFLDFVDGGLNVTCSSTVVLNHCESGFRTECDLTLFEAIRQS
ncbi:hypothetical protein Tco_1045435 [Tanacetum coccineum]|uniref:Uncharacterized protein n=1 Tax=Tanacetum coccineum TaxID=301880 RepID=A0ABQ5GSV8_9ASTR